MTLTTNLWFDTQAEEAAKFYVSIFPNSRIGRVSRYTKEGYEFHHKPEGSVLTVEFEINGSPFLALNGGPEFQFNESVSFIVNCQDQKEIDYYWEKLTEGGDPNAQQCGWLKDKYGVSWQVVPAELSDMIVDADRKKVERVMKPMFSMKKLDLETFRKAYRG